MEQPPVNDSNWNRKLIRIFWWILLIYEAAATIGLFVDISRTPDQWGHSFVRFQVIPTCLQLVLMAIGHAAVYLFKRYSDFIMIVWTMTMVGLFIICIPELNDKYELMCVPVLLSSSYFQRKLIVFAYVSSLVCIGILVAANFYRGLMPSAYEMIVSAAVVTATAVVCFAIMNKGLDLITQLKDSVVREQELLIRNVMIDRLSKVDALTDLFNHRSFQEHTDHLISHIPHDTPLELALMDIDNFKRINDTYGHWVGDEVLKTIGSILKQTLSSDDMAFRYGGEEFAVLFVGKRHDEVMALCETLLHKVRGTLIPEIPDQRITMSIGVAPYDRNTLKKAWFQRVDECLYTAKRYGKNRIYAQAAD